MHFYRILKFPSRDRCQSWSLELKTAISLTNNIIEQDFFKTPNYSSPENDT